jgi:transposase
MPWSDRYPFTPEVAQTIRKPDYDFLVGIDWASEAHHVCALDREGSMLAERLIAHSGAGITSLLEWLMDLAHGRADRVAVAIEAPHGALVEMLLDRGIAVYAINPKQLDRFRDRHPMAGFKDDRRDAYVLADSLRTDLHLFRPVKIDDPLIVQSRKFSRMREELQEKLARLSNRPREQVYRFFLQMLALCPAANEPWFWDLIDLIPTPAKAKRARLASVDHLLRK